MRKKPYFENEYHEAKRNVMHDRSFNFPYYQIDISLDKGSFKNNALKNQMQTKRLIFGKI